LQHLAAERLEITPDGARHRCPFCDVEFAVRLEDAVALGVVDERGLVTITHPNGSTQLHHCA
jgi:hypothetical protein